MASDKTGIHGKEKVYGSIVIAWGDAIGGSALDWPALEGSTMGSG